MAERARVTGVVLAAGEGRRMGLPKALVETADGEPWVRRAVGVLRDGGCDEVLVVVGAAAGRVRAVVEDVRPVPALVEAHDWGAGMGASLRAGLQHLVDRPAGDAALVMLVDLPDVGPQVVRRVRGHVDAAEDRRSTLARATYDGRPGHPVLIGRDHWSAMAATLSGDEGGRRYLAEHDAVGIECGDLATGRDQDTPTGSPGPE
ncbi:nucleotidyltransferase family protein [Mumia sp. DW29H23]|uniref:nucleotidyltransferase family protein n=1 Tax=Mumia sp. DW29H23 TaxID=3421241 RepID=UPI003D687D3D